MRKYIAENGLQSHIFIDSAGTHDFHVGGAPDKRAVAAALKRGVDIAGFRARLVTPEDFYRFDHILAMDSANMALLERMRPPHSRARLSLILAYSALNPGDDLPDPYYGGAIGFERVLDLLEDAVAGLIEDIQQSNN